MSRATTVTLIALSFMACVVSVAESAEDFLQVNTVWSGEIRQGTAAFPAAIYIKGRDKDRIRGEIHFQVGSVLNKLTFQGNIIDGRTVAWITDKKEGAVTYPGLYIGTLKNKSLSGIWQVPSANQYDIFTVKLGQ